MFAYQGFIFDDNGADGLAIGLDMFLGGKFPYSILGTKKMFSNYMTRTYNKDHLYKKWFSYGLKTAFLIIREIEPWTRL